MPDYTITTSAEQEDLLTWITLTYNAEHDAKLTNEEFIAFRFPQLLVPFAENFQRYRETLLTTKFFGAKPEVQAEVEKLLEFHPKS